MPSFLTDIDLVSPSPVQPASPARRSRRQTSRGNPVSSERKQSRQEEREEEAESRLEQVRAVWNKNRLHHRLRLEEPDFEKVSQLKLPLIERDPALSLKPSKTDAKKRWKKSKTLLKVGTMKSLIGKKKGAANADEGRKSSMRGSRGGKPSTPGDLADFFSPLKKKGGGTESNPLANLMSMVAGAASPTAAASDESKVKDTVARDKLKPKTAMDALNELKVKREGLAKNKIVMKLPDNLKPGDIKVNSTRNGGAMTPKQKEDQLCSRMGIIEQLLVKLEDQPSMTSEEISKIITYMDYNGSGEVDEQEFTNAVRNAKRGLIKDAEVTRLMSKVDNELRIKQIRLGDLFKQLDTSGDGSLSVAELEYGLSMLCDVSWETECERRKLKRQAGFDRWRDKENVRDKTKNWLTAVESLPAEFVTERGFFCRDIKTPERFEKYLQVVVNGPDLTKTKEQKEAEMEEKKSGKVNVTQFHFDLDSLENESVHDEVMSIVEEEMSIMSASVNAAKRKERRSIAGIGAKDWGGFGLAQFGMGEEDGGDDDGSLGESSIGENSLGDSSVGAGSVGAGSLGSMSLMTMDTQASSASFVLGQIRKARGQKDTEDVEMESLIMLTCPDGKSTLASIKQRYFEEKLCKNLYRARTSSLSNNYYLPGQVLEVLRREEMIKNCPKARLPKEIEEIGRKVRAREMRRREAGNRGAAGRSREGQSGSSVGSRSHTPRLKTPQEVMEDLMEEKKSWDLSVAVHDDCDYEDENEELYDIPTEIVVE